MRERYADFGPTLATEKLAAQHGCTISRETSRGWMIADGLWTDRRHRLPSPHQPRRWRECWGELVQIDGSGHAWFENRGGMCALLAFVDDATTRKPCVTCGSEPEIQLSVEKVKAVLSVIKKTRSATGAKMAEPKAQPSITAQPAPKPIS